MTTQRYERIPEFTQGDRLRKARSLTGLTTREFADQLGISHGTVNSAETDKRAVRRITLNAWAMATGVPVEWLEHGEQPGPAPVDPDDGPGGDPNELQRLTAQKRDRTRGSHTRRYAPAA